MGKRIIEVFMLEEEQNSQSLSNKGCCSSGCGCDCGPNKTLSIKELVERFLKKYNHVGKFKLYELTRENRTEFIKNLNKVLQDSGEVLVASELNLDFVLSKVAPLIAVDRKIISVKNHPDEEQLYNAIMTGKIIPTKSSCC